MHRIFLPDPAIVQPQRETLGRPLIQTHFAVVAIDGTGEMKMPAIRTHNAVATVISTRDYTPADYGKLDPSKLFFEVRH